MSGLNNFPQYGNYPNMNGGFGSYQGQLEKYLFDQATQRNQQNQPSTNMDFLPVSSEEEAEKFIVKKGETIWFRHSSEPEIYVKSVSSIGEPDFGAYYLVKKEKKEKTNKTEETKKEESFVTLDNFNAFESNVQNIMGEINKHIESVEQKLEKMSKNNEGGKKYVNPSQTQKVGV